MKTAQLQSMLCRNAATITLLTAMMLDQKAHAKGSQLKESRRRHYIEVHKLRAKIIKLADIQKALKFDIHASKLARLQAVGHRRTKHGMDDPRYEEWLSKINPEQSETDYLLASPANAEHLARSLTQLRGGDCC